MRINRRFMLSLLVATAALWMYTSAAIAQEHEHAMKVGKTGEVTFDTQTKIGDLTLPPGRYKFQHTVESTGHFVYFIQWNKQLPASYGVSKTKPGEVPCRLEPLEKKASQTLIYSVQEDGVKRVTRVEIAGENVAHVF